MIFKLFGEVAASPKASPDSMPRVEALNWLRKSASNGVVQAKLILTELQ